MCPASATTCRCRCRRSTAAAIRARRSRCASTPTCARISSRSTVLRPTLELAMFERLIAVSGIGPKLALSVLSGIEPRELVGAIQRNDLARLTAHSRRRQEDRRAHLRRAARSAAEDDRAPRAGVAGRFAARRSRLRARESRLPSAGDRQGRSTSCWPRKRRRAVRRRAAGGAEGSVTRMTDPATADAVARRRRRAGRRASGRGGSTTTSARIASASSCTSRSTRRTAARRGARSHAALRPARASARRRWRT